MQSICIQCIMNLPRHACLACAHCFFQSLWPDLTNFNRRRSKNNRPMAEDFVKFISKSHPKLWKGIKKQQKKVKKQRRKSMRANNADAARQKVEEEWIICAPQPSSLLKTMSQSSTGCYNLAWISIPRILSLVGTQNNIPCILQRVM